jgi:hypothetical protein
MQNKILQRIGANKLDLALYSKNKDKKSKEETEYGPDEKRIMSYDERMQASEMLK